MITKGFSRWAHLLGCAAETRRAIKKSAARMERRSVRVQIAIGKEEIIAPKSARATEYEM